MDAQDFQDLKGNFLTKKNLIALLLAGITLLIIPVGIKLVREQQLLKTRATGEEITFVPKEGVVACNGTNCTTKETTVDIALRSPFGPPGPPLPTPTPTSPPVPQHFISLGNFTYVKDGQQKLNQSAVADDGHTVYTRECEITSSGVNWSGCNGADKWTKTSLSIPGTGGKIIGYDAFTQDVSGQMKLVQSLLAEDGNTTYTRECDVTSSGVNWSGCNGAESWRVSSLSSSGISGGSIQAYAVFTYTENGASKLLQSFIAQDGVTSYGRVCDVTPSGVNWSGCNRADKWSTNSLSALGLSTTSYISTAAFSYSENGAPKLFQLLLGADGMTVFSRVCDITSSGVNWSGCNGVDKWTRSNLTQAGLPNRR